MSPSVENIKDAASTTLVTQQNHKSTPSTTKDRNHDVNPISVLSMKFSSSPSPSRRVIFPIIHDKTLATHSSNSNITSHQHGTEQHSYASGNTSNVGMIRQHSGHNHYQLASTPRCLEKYSTNSKILEKAPPTTQISILRRKTSSQSSLSRISESFDFEEVESSNKKIDNTTRSPSIPSLTHSSSTSIPSLARSNSWCSDDCILSLTSQVEDVDFRRSHSGTCMCSCMRKGTCNSYRNSKCVANINENIGISFDPRVWVYEYEQNNIEANGENWYDTNEIERFRQNAISCIQEKELKHNDFNDYSNTLPLKVFFNHPALVSGCIAQKEIIDTSSTTTISSSCNKRSDINLKVHIKNILLIDSDELFLKIFKRGFEYMFPHSSITTCNTLEKALQLIKNSKSSSCSRKRSTHGFDIILIDESIVMSNNNSISSSSTSSIFKKLVLEREDAKQESTFYFQGEKILHHTRYTLVIGAVKYGSEDEGDNNSKQLMNDSGADIIWTKNAPPTMNKNLRDELLYNIMNHRNC